MDSYEVKLKRFLSEYVRIPKEYLDKDGTIQERWLPLCVCVLMDSGVFTKYDMKKKALADYGIIIPDRYFETETWEKA